MKFVVVLLGIFGLTYGVSYLDVFKKFQLFLNLETKLFSIF